MRRLSYIPPQLKKGYIIPLPKKDKNSLLQDNYRGITITSTFSKLHENIEAPRLRELFQGEQSSMQRGFSNGSSSTYVALMVPELMNEARDSMKELFIASLDARKAFDVVYQKSLFVKLFDIGVEHDLWRIMLNWYDGASIQVRWNNQYSREFELLQGLRQGRCTSTDIYKIFINPLLRNLESSRAGFGSLFVGSPTCADDILLAANSVSDLQIMLQQAAEYASQRRYVLHPEKSTILILNSKTPLNVWREVQPLKLKDAPVHVASECTHLGLLRTASNNNKALIDERLKLARRTTYMLMGAGLHGKNGINPLVSNSLCAT